MSVESRSREATVRLTLDEPGTKLGFATRVVPLARMVHLSRAAFVPKTGDLALAEVVKVGKNARLETRGGVVMELFPGDKIVVSFGDRYATDQFEGYVPAEPVGTSDACDLLSMGGVCGRVLSRHVSVAEPTRLRLLGAVCDEDGIGLNSRAFGLAPLPAPVGLGPDGPEVIVVVGSTMNSGKTTTVGTISRSLSRAGFRVAAGTVTGTAAGKDARYFESSGARPAIDFTGAGYPSTYMLDREELLGLYHGILAYLRTADPDYVVLEIADGILQRETRMLLDSQTVVSSIDHLFFTAGDGLSVESGVRFLKDRGLPLRATSGVVSGSRLNLAEAEEATGVPCLGLDRLMSADLLAVLGAATPVLNGSADRGAR